MDPELVDITLSFLSKLVKQNDEIIKLLKQAQEVEGTTFPNRFTLSAGKSVTKIDFTEKAEHQNLPPNVSLQLPSIPVSSILLYNEGLGDLYYTTNPFMNTLEANSLLLPGETRQITIPSRKIKYLNIVANTQAVTLRMEVLI